MLSTVDGFESGGTAGIQIADREEVEKYPEQVQRLLQAIAPFKATTTSNDWIRRVLVTDGSRISDFDLSNPAVRQIGEQIGLILAQGDYIQDIVRRMYCSHVTVGESAPKPHDRSWSFGRSFLTIISYLAIVWAVLVWIIVLVGSEGALNSLTSNEAYAWVDYLLRCTLFGALGAAYLHAAHLHYSYKRDKDDPQ